MKHSESFKSCFALVLILGASYAAFCQKISDYKVIDSLTKEAVQNAYIINTNNELIDISDYDGKFKIHTEIIDTISLKCIGYKTTIINTTTLKTNPIIELIPDTIALSSITITAISPKAIVKRCILAIDENYFTKDTVIHGRHRINVYEDSCFVRQFIHPVKITQKSKKQLLDVEWPEPDSMFMHDKSLISETFLFDHIMHNRGFMNLENLDLWEFEIAGYIDHEDQVLMIISANYISNNNVFHFGKIFIDPDDYGILQIEYNYHWNDRHYIKTDNDSLYSHNSTWTGFASYTKSPSGYHLSNLKYFIKQEIYNETKPLLHKKLWKTYKIRSEFSSNLNGRPSTSTNLK